MEAARNRGLDTLRAAAILMVIARHSLEYLKKPLPDLFNHGWAGVDLFFVLSGYLIGSQLFKEVRATGEVSARRFYFKRAFRILPPYLLMLLIYKTWPAFSAGERMEPAWRFLLFVSNVGWTGGAFSHAWSLNVEEHFYLALPLLVTLHAWKPRIFRPAWIIALVVLVGAALRFHAWSIMAPWSASIYRPTYCHLDGLAIGAGLAAVQLARPAWLARLTKRPWLLNLFGLALVAGGMWTYHGQKGAGAALFTFPLVGLGFGALVASSLNPESWLARARLPGAQSVALAAYSLYLSHKGMIVLGIAAAGGRERFWLALAYSALFVALGGAVLYFAVEKPFLKLRDRLLAFNVRSGVPPRREALQSPGR